MENLEFIIGWALLVTIVAISCYFIWKYYKSVIK